MPDEGAGVELGRCGAGRAGARQPVREAEARLRDHGRRRGIQRSADGSGHPDAVLPGSSRRAWWHPCRAKTGDGPTGSPPPATRPWPSGWRRWRASCASDAPACVSRTEAAHEPPAAPHRLLVACYPARWRERYGYELLQVLADRGSGWRDLPNSLGGVATPGSTAGSGRPRRRARAAGGCRAAPPGRSGGPVRRAGRRASRAIGVVATHAPAGEMSRRRFPRRMLAVGTGPVLLEFGVGTVSFLWPQIREGLGAKFKVGTIDRCWPPSRTSPTAGPTPTARLGLPGQRASRQGAGDGQPGQPAEPRRLRPAGAAAQVPAPGLPGAGAVRVDHPLPVPLPPEHLQHPGQKMFKGPAERGLTGSLS